MKEISQPYRCAALLICMCILFSYFCWPTEISLAEDMGYSYCDHHPNHDENCGYAAGSPCSHVHDENCYTLICTHKHTDECYSDILPNDAEAETEQEYDPYNDADSCDHIHSDECFVLACSHEHDAECGYTESHPCEFVCKLCSVTVNTWTWIDPYDVLQPGEYFYGFNDVDWVLGVPNLSTEQLSNILPSRISALLKTGEKAELPIVWDLKHPVKYPIPDWMRDGVKDESELPHYYIITAALPNGYSLAENAPGLFVLVQSEAIATLAESDDTEQLIAAYDFENSSDRLEDKSGNGVQATLLDGNANNYRTENGNTYLDLTGNNAYLSLPAGILSGLSELTVEMTVRWIYPGVSGSNWAFYAAPNASAPNPGNYASIAFGESSVDTVNAQRQQGTYNPSDRFNAVAIWPSDNAWHTIKVIFEEYATTIYIDGTQVFKDTGSIALSDCIGQNGIVWFGGAAWPWNNNTGRPGEFFNGAIDNIKISGKTPPPPDYGPFIITDRVVDPADTVVDFFDYWTENNNGFSPIASDYQAIENINQAVSGINRNHLLLFAGFYGLTGNISNNLNSIDGAGAWNAWTGDIQYGGASAAPFNPTNPDVKNYKPYQNIVARTMAKGTVGNKDILYPKLNSEELNKNITNTTGNFDNGGGRPWYSLLQSRNGRDESLEYLFNPDMEHSGKASYTNVTGLFRIDSQGYYYYNSDEAFAELNADSGFAQKGQVNGGVTDGNHITLYNAPWRYTGNDAADRFPLTANDPGQFFPFNHWADLFNVKGDTAEQLHTTLRDQANLQPLNHYFGMTVTTKFQQPKDGKISPSTDMSFTFSGDDDVWIFIDGVLVGDIGGIHLPDGIKINFSTGAITYQAIQVRNSANGPILDPQDITHMNSTIRDMFKLAGAEDDAAWDAEHPDTFASGSIHTLQFYYMERGNDVSNCSISFNLEPILKDSIKKVNEDGDTLDNAEFSLFEADVVSEFKNSDGTYTDAFKAIKWHVAEEFTTVKPVVENIKSRNALNGKTKEDDPNNSGYYDLVDKEGEAIDFTNYPDGSYFILQETVTPAGYRLNKNIVLQYHYDTNTFTVVNKYETGAYASFVAKWVQRTADVNFAAYDPETGAISQGEQINIRDNTPLQDGLSIVVPVFKQTVGTDNSGLFLRWLPMYGSNTLGWNTIADSYQIIDEEKNHNITEPDFIHDVALAAFLQITGGEYRDWYLKWDDETQRLTGDMNNLPGDATRYVINSGDNADLNLVTLFISVDELAVLLDLDPSSLPDDDTRYEKLREALNEKISAMRADLEAAHPETEYSDEDVAKALLDSIITDKKYTEGQPFKLMYTDEFTRYYRTALYIPNERRELRVRKVDGNTEEGVVYINGAVFAIFETPEQAAAFPGDAIYNSTAEALEALAAAGSSGIRAYGETADVMLDSGNIQEGLLIFRENDNTSGAGFAHIEWPSDRTNSTEKKVLWLKEIYSPDGYARNENLVRIEVGDLAIYANATGYDSSGNILPENSYARNNDGIRVYAALGKLTQTLVKYALNNNVDITLRDILITLQHGEMDSNGVLNHNKWKDSTSDTYDLHYGLYSEALTSQYGQHAYEQELPIFITQDGYIRIMPRQSGKDFSDIDKDRYYITLRTNLTEQLEKEAIEQYKKDHDDEEPEGDDLTSLKNWVAAKVDEIITELKDLHSYNAKRDDLEGVDLDGLFGLMNVVEVTNTVIPVSLKISKVVKGNAPKDDIYKFSIKFEATNEMGKWDSHETVEGEYHAYLHPTDHQVFVYDRHGNKIQETDPVTGMPRYEEDGVTPIYLTRPCGPADHTNDEVHVHLVVDGNGNGLVKYIATNRTEILTLKDGESFMIVGLPQGARFTITETIESKTGTSYATTTERRNDMRPYPGDGQDYIYTLPLPGSGDPDKDAEITVKGVGRTVSGILQTAKYAWDYQHAPDYKQLPDDPDELGDIVIPASEVTFINTLSFNMPAAGGSGTAVIMIPGALLLIAVLVFFIYEFRRKEPL